MPADIRARIDAHRRRAGRRRPGHRGAQSVHRRARRHRAQGDRRRRAPRLLDRARLPADADALRALARFCIAPPRSSAAGPTRSPTSSPPSAASARRIRSTRSAAPATCSCSPATRRSSDDGQIFSCDLTPHGKRRKVYTLREPLLGVISAITPFNHPLNQVAHKVAPAIATNNRMVLKPTEKTPLSALLLADILYEAGLAAGDVLGGDRRPEGDRRRDADQRGRRSGDLHRRRRGRQVHRRQGRLQAPGAGARRQRSADRHGRRRHRRSRDAGRRRLVQELGPALHGDQAHARAAVGRRPVRRARCWRRPRPSSTATRWMQRPTWAR